MKKLFQFCVSIALVMVMITPAKALMINEGESCVYSFDFSSSTPIAPYQSFEQDVVLDVYVNSGTNHARLVTYLPIPNVWNSEEPGWAMGWSTDTAGATFSFDNHVLSPIDKYLVNDIYSVRFEADEGSFEILSTNLRMGKVVGGSWPDYEYEWTGSAGGNPVPEPTAGLLLATCLAGVAVFGRKRLTK